jgi:hypothetical protein
MGFEFRCHGCGELPELQGMAEGIRPGASITRAERLAQALPGDDGYEGHGSVFATTNFDY